jgi:RNA polymerase sigma-70 factor (ECF subfamily)
LHASDPRSDHQLVEAANRGDADAFEALYLRYRDWTYRLAYRFTGNADDALDVLQDAFAYLLNKFPGFRLTARITTLLYPAVKHLALTQRRRQPGPLVHDEPLGDDDLLDSIPAAPPSPPNHDTEALHAVLKTLPTPQREVLLMRFLDDMSLDEIATALDVPVGTVKSRLHHALAALRADPHTRDYLQD